MLRVCSSLRLTWLPPPVCCSAAVASAPRCPSRCFAPSQLLPIQVTTILSGPSNASAQRSSLLDIGGVCGEGQIGQLPQSSKADARLAHAVLAADVSQASLPVDRLCVKIFLSRLLLLLRGSAHDHAAFEHECALHRMEHSSRNDQLV